MVHREAMGVFFRIAATRPTFVDLFHLMLTVVQQIVIKMYLVFSFRRPPAFTEEVDCRLQQQVSRLSFFAELRILSRQPEYAHQPWQGKTLQNECHQDERKGQKDDEASLRKRASVVEGEWQGVGSGQRDNTTHASP